MLTQLIVSCNEAYPAIRYQKCVINNLNTNVTPWSMHVPSMTLSVIRRLVDIQTEKQIPHRVNHLQASATSPAWIIVASTSQSQITTCNPWIRVVIQWFRLNVDVWTELVSFSANIKTQEVIGSSHAWCTDLRGTWNVHVHSNSSYVGTDWLEFCEH